jgi:site-specific DNA-methyltransferase (adenine-specific)
LSWKDLFPKENRFFETENGILYNAEAIEMMSKFPEKIFDAIITDPPYGATACKWDAVIPFEDMWRELKRIRKDRTPIVLFSNQPFTSLLVVSNLNEYKHRWIWNKNNSAGFATVKFRPFQICEDIIVFGKKAVNYYPIMEERGKPRIKDGYSISKNYNIVPKKTAKKNNIYYPKNLLNFSNAAQKGKQHPTQKPLALMEYLIKTYSKEGDLVLDFTCGSGTTLVAAEKLSRRWVGIEISGEYCKIAKNRIEDLMPFY